MRYGEHNTLIQANHDGTLIYEAAQPLGPIAKTTSIWLHTWAIERPTSIFLAERSGAGWRTVSYAETLELVRAIGGSLIERGLTAETPILVISGNSVDHALLALAAQYVGVPTVPIAEQYSLIPQARGRLIEAAELVKILIVTPRAASPPSVSIVGPLGIR